MKREIRADAFPSFVSTLSIPTSHGWEEDSFFIPTNLFPEYCNRFVQSCVRIFVRSYVYECAVSYLLLSQKPRDHHRRITWMCPPSKLSARHRQEDSLLSHWLELKGANKIHKSPKGRRKRRMGERETTDNPVWIPSQRPSFLSRRGAVVYYLLTQQIEGFDRFSSYFPSKYHSYQNNSFSRVKIVTTIGDEMGWATWTEEDPPQSHFSLFLTTMQIQCRFEIRPTSEKDGRERMMQMLPIC